MALVIAARKLFRYGARLAPYRNDFWAAIALQKSSRWPVGSEPKWDYTNVLIPVAYFLSVGSKNLYQLEHDAAHNISVWIYEDDVSDSY